MMDLTVKSLLEWTKLTVQRPRVASELVKAAKLPLEVSVLMIVLAGVVSGVSSGFLDYLIGSPPLEFALGDGTVLSFERSGPFAQGAYAVATGLALAYSVYRIGRGMGGQGSLPDIMAVTAVLQMVMTVILVAQTFALLIVPLLGFALLVFGLFVFFRGLGHAVNVGHDLDDMGKSVAVIAVSFVAVVVMAFVLVAVLGLGPEGVILEDAV